MYVVYLFIKKDHLQKQHELMAKGFNIMFFLGTGPENSLIYLFLYICIVYKNKIILL